MKRCVAVLAVLLLAAGCAEEPEQSGWGMIPQTTDEPRPSVEVQPIAADFMKQLSEGNAENAFRRLAPELADAWTAEGFAQDWQTIRTPIEAQWNPNPVAAAERSAETPVAQAVFQLHPRPDTVTSAELISTSEEGGARIIEVAVRLKAPGPIYWRNKVVAEALVHTLAVKDFETTRQLLADSMRDTIPEERIREMAALFPQETDRKLVDHYTMCFNGIWISGVLIGTAQDPARFLEIGILSDKGKDRIVTLSFKNKADGPPDLPPAILPSRRIHDQPAGVRLFDAHLLPPDEPAEPEEGP